MKVYLDAEDIKKMEEAATCLRDRLLIRLLFRLGRRVSEALALKAEDVDFGQGTVTIFRLIRSFLERAREERRDINPTISRQKGESFLDQKEVSVPWR